VIGKNLFSLITYHSSLLSPVSHRKIQKIEQAFTYGRFPPAIIPVESCPYVKPMFLLLPGIAFAVMQEFCRALLVWLSLGLRRVFISPHI
jgi:hypothetical protein